MPWWSVLDFRNLREDISVQSVSPLSFPIERTTTPPSLPGVCSLSEEEAGGIWRMPDTAQLPITANLGAQSQIFPVGKKRLPEIKLGKKKQDRNKKPKKDSGLKEKQKMKVGFRRRQCVLPVQSQGGPGPCDWFPLLGREGIVLRTRQGFSAMTGWTLHTGP